MSGLEIVLIILLIVILAGGGWGYRGGYLQGPLGIVLLVLLVIVVCMFFGYRIGPFR